MSKFVTVATVLLLIFICRAADAQNTNDLSRLSWLSGQWVGAKDGMEMEEFWLAPKGNTMLGLHRDVSRGKTVSFEFLRIEADEAAITYWASPKGSTATPFKMIEQGNTRVVFENPDHDFPTRIIYWLDKDGSLHAKIEGTIGSKPTTEEWSWRKLN